MKLSDSEIEAYVKARMPATQAAISSVLQELKKRISLPVKTLLDIGAGPGTGYLATKVIFPELEKAFLIEREEKMIVLGKSLISSNEAVNWIHGDIRRVKWDKADLALLGYSFGELDIEDCFHVLENVWKSTIFLVIVEPGTPKGFERIKFAREWVLQRGGFLLAPCPHQNNCPMAQNDWCHFSTRLERSKEHRKMKDGVLGWEDEKFSYLIASHEISLPTENRILRHPEKKSGHIRLHLCTKDGLRQKIISKKQKDLYRFARKLKWGDYLVFSSNQVIEKAKNCSYDQTMNKSPKSSNDPT